MSARSKTDLVKFWRIKYHRMRKYQGFIIHFSKENLVSQEILAKINVPILVLFLVKGDKKQWGHFKLNICIQALHLKHQM